MQLKLINKETKEESYALGYDFVLNEILIYKDKQFMECDEWVKVDRYILIWEDK